MAKLIAVTGTHGTGKTTLSFELAATYKKKGCNVKVIQEVARSCPFPLNDKMTRETALWIYFEHSKKELEAKKNHDIIICDRTAFDSFVYGQYIGIDDVEEFENLSKNHLKNAYAEIYFVRPDLPLIVDSIRSADLNFQKKIDELFTVHMEEVEHIQLQSSHIFNKEQSWKSFCL